MLCELWRYQCVICEGKGDLQIYKVIRAPHILFLSTSNVSDLMIWHVSGNVWMGTVPSFQFMIIITISLIIVLMMMIVVLIMMIIVLIMMIIVLIMMIIVLIMMMMISDKLLENDGWLAVEPLVLDHCGWSELLSFIFIIVIVFWKIPTIIIIILIVIITSIFNVQVFQCHSA